MECGCGWEETICEWVGSVGGALLWMGNIGCVCVSGRYYNTTCGINYTTRVLQYTFHGQSHRYICICEP